MSAFCAISLLAVALAVAPTSAPGERPVLELPEDVFAQPPGGDALDLLVMANGRAAVVRVHINIGTKSFRTSWADFALQFHAFLDRNDDHVLTVEEANRVPWGNHFFNQGLGAPMPRPGMSPAPIDANPRDGRVSSIELVNYLLGARGLQPFAVEFGASPDPRTQALFSALDRNHDMFVTPAELARASDLFVTLDGDEDETLSLDELTPNRSMLPNQAAFSPQRARPFDPSASPVIPLTSAEFRAAAASRLEAALGQGTPRRIGPDSLAIQPDAFRGADGDGDGLLDRGELARYLTSPAAHLEIAILLAPTRDGRARIEKRSAPAGSSAARLLSTRFEPSGALVVEFAGSEFGFTASEALNDVPNLLRLLKPRFEHADSNKDGAVDAREVGGDFLLQRAHLVGDHNGDGKLTDSELRLYLELNVAAEQAGFTVSVADQGNTLHERLDADRDGRLSVRELRAAPSKMMGWDADQDGRISLAEIPRRTQLNLCRGASPTRNRSVAVSSPAAVVTPGASSDRPAWFVGMDRNHDGDVSAREFLGTPDQFRRFDADGDGLIDGDEAKRVR